MKQCLSLDFSCFQVVLLADWLRDVSLHSMSPLNQVVDQGDKHCWWYKAQAWEVEGRAVVICLVHQPAWNTEQETGDKITQCVKADE